MSDDLRKIEERFERLLKEAVSDLRSDMKEQFISKADADEKFVKWRTFVWVMGILMGIIVGINGVIYSKLEAVEEKVSLTREDVATLKPFADFLKELEIIIE